MTPPKERSMVFALDYRPISEVLAKDEFLANSPRETIQQHGSMLMKWAGRPNKFRF